jgi:hypothetical protein
VTANGSLVNLAFAPLMLLLPILVRDRLAADRAAHGLSYERRSPSSTRSADWARCSAA